MLVTILIIFQIPHPTFIFEFYPLVLFGRLQLVSCTAKVYKASFELASHFRYFEWTTWIQNEIFVLDTCMLSSSKRFQPVESEKPRWQHTAFQFQIVKVERRSYADTMRSCKMLRMHRRNFGQLFQFYVLRSSKLRSSLYYFCKELAACTIQWNERKNYFRKRKCCLHLSSAQPTFFRRRNYHLCCCRHLPSLPLSSLSCRSLHFTVPLLFLGCCIRHIMVSLCAMKE